MARRGEVLRRHILDKAKELLLELGYERTSMDAVAARAETSKRSLYAHFPTKEVLFLAVVGYIDELFRDRMQTPAAYADEPIEAASLFCARFLQMLQWETAVQTCHLGIEAARQFPDASAQLHAAVFGASTASLASYLEEDLGLDPARSAALADDLLGATVYRFLPGLLLKVSPTHVDLPAPDAVAQQVDVDAIRQTAAALLSAVAD